MPVTLLFFNGTLLFLLCCLVHPSHEDSALFYFILFCCVWLVVFGCLLKACSFLMGKGMGVDLVERGNGGIG